MMFGKRNDLFYKRFCIQMKKLLLKNLFEDSKSFCLADLKQFGAFAVIAYVFGVLTVACWDTLLLWPILALLYVVWGMFFRFYFNRKPYFVAKVFFQSLVPSSKVVVLSVVVGTILIVLPFVPLFVSTSAEFNEQYTRFLQGDIEGVGILLLIANVLFLAVSPLIVYRPFLAWIAALIGRSGSLKLAWEKTKGNYANFLIVAAGFNAGVMLVHGVVLLLGGNNYVSMLFVAPLMVFFNVMTAKMFEFFFLDVE